MVGWRKVMAESDYSIGMKRARYTRWTNTVAFCQFFPIVNGANLTIDMLVDVESAL